MVIDVLWKWSIIVSHFNAGTFVLWRNWIAAMQTKDERMVIWQIEIELSYSGLLCFDIHSTKVRTELTVCWNSMQERDFFSYSRMTSHQAILCSMQSLRHGCSLYHIERDLIDTQVRESKSTTKSTVTRARRNQLIDELHAFTLSQSNVYVCIHLSPSLPCDFCESADLVVTSIWNWRPFSPIWAIFDEFSHVRAWLQNLQPSLKCSAS